jgi:hypothetical protein
MAWDLEVAFVCVRSTLLFLFLLFTALDLPGQAVDESASSVAVGGNGVAVELSVQSAVDTPNIPARLELVDTLGSVVATVSTGVVLKKGRQKLSFVLPLDVPDLDSEEDLVWYRLRYLIGNTWGTISLSRMMSDVFELRVAGSSDVVAGMVYRVRVSAVDPFNRKPVSGVKVEAKLSLDLRSGEDDKLILDGVSETDASGSAVMEFSIPINVALDGDGEITVKGRKNGVVREASNDLESVLTRREFLLMTDKMLYQPEQTVNIRGIYLEGSDRRSIVSAREVDIRIEDEDSVVLFREKRTTSDFGIAFVSWNSQPNTKLGRYSVVVRDEDGESIGRSTFQISRYDLPNFAVRVDPDKPFYLPTDKQAELVVMADYLFGKPVTKGNVRVVQEKTRNWNWKEQRYDIDEGAIFEGETDAEGKFTARFDLTEAFHDLRESSWRRYRDISFAAYFTDPTTNRTEQRRFDIRISAEPIHVYFTRASRESHPAFPVEGYVTASYADGTPAECSVEILGSESDDEEKAVLLARTQTNSYGVAKAEFRLPVSKDDIDEFHLGIVAKDRFGRKGTHSREFEIGDADDVAIRVSTHRSIIVPGEPLNIELASTVRNGTLRVDIVRGLTVLSGFDVEIRNGRGKLTVPYEPQFEGEIKIAAYQEPATDDDEIVRAIRRVIYPVRTNLKVSADLDKATYKPGDAAKLSFGVMDAAGNAAESALGIAIIDTAVVHRARTNDEFGSPFSNFWEWLGYGNSVGGVNIKDLRELDVSKPISPELQLVAEVILSDAWYRPSVFFSNNLLSDAKYEFGSHYTPQAETVKRALRTHFAETDGQYPTDEPSLIRIMRAKSIELDLLRDPWEERYRAEFGFDRSKAVVRLISNGPDKRPKTADDFEIYKDDFEYFTPIGRKIDEAVKRYYERTGSYIRDRETLLRELGVKELNDIYGRPYEIEFGTQRRMYTINVTSLGRDGKKDKYSWRGDDLRVWTNQIDHFERIEARIVISQQNVAKPPLTVEEFKALLLADGIDVDSLKDGYGNKLYVTVRQYSRFSDRVTSVRVNEYGTEGYVDKKIVTPVTQEVISFMIRSPGEDGKEGTWDDFTLTQVIHVISERTKDDEEPKFISTAAIAQSQGTAAGVITGTITDSSGASVPGATVTATNDASGLVRSVTTNESGRYTIVGLSPGKYTVRADAPGFKSSISLNVLVNTGRTTNVDLNLEIGDISEVVSVEASDQNVINTTSASLGSQVTVTQTLSLPLTTDDTMALLKMQPGTVGSDDVSTPRLRQYFPETLLWNPELITDSNGRATIDLKMADNITTWKIYTIASTRDGKVGIAEKEVTAFQTFFADLDPPRYLTDGDEIFLPVQLRNYSENLAKVDVTMDTEDWFTMLADKKQQIDVPSGESRNAVFGFRASRPVKDGLQRVTAIADNDSDAVEKPVTVRPNGHEVTRVDSRFFSGAARFGVEFPENAIPGTSKVELKIYPDLFAHVTEAVEGLLMRPYGCGEQTVSSTYPNLMIVNFVKDDRPIRRTAMRNLIRGTERLLGYQGADGGFTYWGGRSSSDLALTAYALRFLTDASKQITIDQSAIERAEKWLLDQQRSDGSWFGRHSWETSENAARTKMLTAYVSRSLSFDAQEETDRAPDKISTDAQKKEALAKAINYLHRRNAEIDDPYSLALLGTLVLENGDLVGAKAIAERLTSLAKHEGSSVYWNLETNTPFNGWGTAGRIESTALVTNFLFALSSQDDSRNELISKAMLFLFKNKDRFGVWHSTQTTINVLQTFLAMMQSSEVPKQSEMVVMVNGAEVARKTVSAPALEPVVIDLTDKAYLLQNEIEVRGPASLPLVATIVASHYVDWKDADIAKRDVNASRALEFDLNCDKKEAVIMEPITCSVRAERVGFVGYGMLLAEIGTPPGADIDREGLKAVMDNDRSVSRYEVLPDRVIFYLWARAGGTRFDLKFRPRYGINAASPASVVYDYYNPEAQVSIAPVRFTVRDR